MFKIRSKIIATILLLAATGTLHAQRTYFPPKDNWEARNPSQLGFDPAKLQAAVQFA
jgi:hypothetical protein